MASSRRVERREGGNISTSSWVELGVDGIFSILDEESVLSGNEGLDGGFGSELSRSGRSSFVSTTSRCLLIRTRIEAEKRTSAHPKLRSQVLELRSERSILSMSWLLQSFMFCWRRGR